MQISAFILFYAFLLIGPSFAAPVPIEPTYELEARATPTPRPSKPPSKWSQTMTAAKTAAKIKIKFKPKPNEAIFWAGRRPGPNPGQVLSLEYDARKIAKQQGKSTLEDHLEKYNIRIPPASENRYSEKLWDIASKTFANRAKGETHVYLGTTIRPQSVYTNKEKPILMASKRITRVTEHNVHAGTSQVVKGQASPVRGKSPVRPGSPAPRSGSASRSRSPGHARRP